MSQISLKSISGITSITTPAGVDNQLTLHNNNTTEAVKLDIAGNLHFNNHLNITGISTASNFKTGTSNVHSTGYECTNINASGIVTAAYYVGSGAASLSPSGNADELVIGASNGTRGITIFGATSNIFFGDSGDNDVGQIQYEHSDNSMRFNTNASEKLRIDSNGRLNHHTGSIIAGTLPYAYFSVPTSSYGGVNLTMNLHDPASEAIGKGGGLGFSAVGSSGNAVVRAAIRGNVEATTSEAGYLTLHTRTNGGGNDERLRIDSSGHIHTGYTSGFGNDHLNILASDGGGIAIASNNVGNATAGDILGSLSFQGYLNTASYSSAEARISAIVPSNHTGSSAATDMVFYTKPASTGPGSAPSERLRIGSLGQIGIGGANYGTSGQVLTSQGSGSAVQWSSPAAPSVSQNTGTANNNILQTLAQGITWHTDKNNTEQTVGNVSYCNTSDVYAIDIYLGMLFNQSGGTYNYNSSHCYLTGYIFQSGKNYLNDGSWTQAQHFDMYFNTFGTVYTIPWDPSGTQTLKMYVNYSYNTSSNNSFRFDLISKHLK